MAGMGDLRLVGPGSATVFRKVGVGGGSVDVDVTPDGRKVLVAQRNRTVVVDATTAPVAVPIPVGAFGIAVPKRGDLFCTVDASSDSLRVIRTDDHALVATHAICSRPPASAASF
jgi:DNA-binding beta-propeller fold protein YncE